MPEQIVCAVCGAKMTAGRARCLRCGEPLRAAESSTRDGAAAEEESWPSWVPGAAALALVVGIVVALSLVARPAPPTRTGPMDSGRPATEPPAPANAAPVVDYRVPTPDRAGNAAYFRGDYAGALEQYRKAVERNPQDAESLSNLGIVLVRQGRAEEAITYHERAIALNPARWAYHFNLAHACGMLNQWDRAVEEYRTASRLFPDDYVTEYNLGMALHKKGDEEAAIAEFRKAIAESPEDAGFHLSLAISLERLGRLTDAAQSYRRFLELAPTAPEVAGVKAKLAQIESSAPTGTAPPVVAGQPSPKGE